MNFWCFPASALALARVFHQIESKRNSASMAPLAWYGAAWFMSAALSLVEVPFDYLMSSIWLLIISIWLLNGSIWLFREYIRSYLTIRLANESNSSTSTDQKPQVACRPSWWRVLDLKREREKEKREKKGKREKKKERGKKKEKKGGKYKLFRFGHIALASFSTVNEGCKKWTRGSNSYNLIFWNRIQL